MKRTAPFFLTIVLLAGCAGGPTKDYYNPVIPDAKFKGAAAMARVDDVAAETARLVREGYTVVGRTDYTGKHPEAVELKAQAKRAGANHVIYSSVYVAPPKDAPGSWHFNVGQGFGSGGTGSGARGYNDVHIVFLGRQISR
ncbi:MAG TPA: hypothetical protein VK530_09225 [Candidatus Acidoferrum sp.]|nr:hypothetical protein [Candidatus Acidoferrum sp.]